MLQSVLFARDFYLTKLHRKCPEIMKFLYSVEFGNVVTCQ